MKTFATTFIAMFEEPIAAWLHSSIIARAQRTGIFLPRIESILKSVNNNHHAVDDTPYGGGAGELMRIDVIAPLVEVALAHTPHVARARKRVVLMDPAGAIFDQDHARRLSTYDELIFVCGRYEGIDARIHHYVDEALSVGDFVLSSGDLAAMTICDATLRMIPGVLNNPESIEHESHMKGRLEASHYTRPKVYDAHEVPAILQSGDHKAIERFRTTEAALKTKLLRPDLLARYPLSPHEEQLLAALPPSVEFPWAPRHE